MPEVPPERWIPEHPFDSADFYGEKPPTYLAVWDGQDDEGEDMGDEQ